MNELKGLSPKRQ